MKCAFKLFLYLRGCWLKLKGRDLWGLWHQRQVPKAWICNHIPQNTVGHNFLSMPKIPASVTKALIFQCVCVRIHKYLDTNPTICGTSLGRVQSTFWWMISNKYKICNYRIKPEDGIPAKPCWYFILRFSSSFYFSPDSYQKVWYLYPSPSFSLPAICCDVNISRKWWKRTLRQQLMNSSRLPCDRSKRHRGSSRRRSYKVCHRKCLRQDIILIISNKILNIMHH